MVNIEFRGKHFMNLSSGFAIADFAHFGWDVEFFIFEFFTNHGYIFTEYRDFPQRVFNLKDP